MVKTTVSATQKLYDERDRQEKRGAENRKKDKKNKAIFLLARESNQTKYT